MKQGYITINRAGLISEDKINIQLKDEKSRNRFIEVWIPLDEFMRALTGVSERPMKYIIEDNLIETLGKERVVQKVNMKLPDGFVDAEEIPRLVAEDFFNRGFLKEGWIIRDNGLGRTQENQPIDGHRIWTYRIEKYVEVEESEAGN